MLKVTRLMVEHQTAPLGLDVTRPCFGWVLDGDGQNVRQAAYALTVEAEGRPVWNTGRVDSGESVSVRYEGAPLASKAVYQVRLTVWDNRGERAQAETSFETGLLEPGDFAARWITHDFPKGETACPVFFKAFSARRPLRARLYASACGIYDAAVNGVPVSEDFFAPSGTSGWAGRGTRPSSAAPPASCGTRTSFTASGWPTWPGSRAPSWACPI